MNYLGGRSTVFLTLWLMLSNSAAVVADNQGNVLMNSEMNPSVTQQQRKIIGVVVDNTGTPVIGANVVEKGTTNGTITDVDGKFSLEISPKSLLQVSFIGYLPQNVVVGSDPSLRIELKEDTQNLEEVVVVAYGAQKKVNLTGAVASIESGKIQNKTFTTVQQAIQGQIPGLTVTQTGGQPGNEALSMSKVRLVQMIRWSLLMGRQYQCRT